MGKGATKAAGRAAESQERIAGRTLDISEGLLKEAAPGRAQVYDFLGGTIKGGPELQRAVAPSINAATQQFYLAKRAAQNLPPGGMRDQALRDVALQEAGTKTGIYSGGVNEAVQRMAAFTSGGTQAGLGGMGTSGGLMGQAGQTFANLGAGKAAGAGEAAGGAGMIAAALI